MPPHQIQAPPEILSIIFRQTFPSSTSLERSVINGPEGTWSEEYKMKRTIVAISKLWRDVGLGLLYSEVIIRRVDSLPTLLRTVSVPDSGIGHLIKKLMISCVVPFGDDLSLFERTVNGIIAHCPSLSHLTMHPSFYPVAVDAEPSEIHLQPLRVSNITPNITHLDWGYCLLLSDLVLLLQHCPNLTSLRFHLHSYDHLNQLDFENALRTLVTLPNLRELYYVRSDSTNGFLDTYVDSVLAAQWSIPQLERFTYGNTRSLGFADIVGFCRIHGRSLRYLHLGPDWRDWILNDTVQKIIDECASLEHLVLWMSGDYDIIHSLSHPKITWVDVWVDLPPMLRRVEKFAQMPIPGLLSLRRLRVFDNRLWRPRATDLPVILPPDAAVERNGFEYTYFGLNIQQLGHLVLQTDQTTNFVLEDSSSSSDDEDKESDFDPDTIPPYDNTSEGWGSSEDDTSSSDSGDSVLDIQEELKDWNPDPKKALAVFSSKLQL